MDILAALIVACVFFPVLFLWQIIKGIAGVMDMASLADFILVDVLISGEWWVVNKCFSSERRIGKMCDFTDVEHRRSAFNYFSNNPPWRVVPQNILNRFQFAFLAGRCPVCGTDREIRPSNRVTQRSMCKWCFETLIAQNASSLCFVCGTVLPESKIRSQRCSPREIAEHIHYGPCTHLWTVIHNVSAGTLEMVREYALPAPLEPLKITDGNTIDAEFETIQVNRDKRLPYITTFKGRPVQTI